MFYGFVLDVSLFSLNLSFLWWDQVGGTNYNYDYRYRLYFGISVSVSAILVKLISVLKIGDTFTKYR